MSTPNPARPSRPRPRPSGFTLIELLVVISIIVLITATALPAILPALASRKVSEGARTLQAVLAGTRDAAIRAGEPRGIRLLPDAQFRGGGPGSNAPLAASRMVAIEPAPDHSDGRVLLFPWTMPGGVQVIVAAEVRARVAGGTVVENYPPTGWYWNIRQGDRIRFEGSGHEFTIAGPVRSGAVISDGTINNPDRYINMDAPTAGGQRYISLPFGVPAPPGHLVQNPIGEAPWNITRRWPPAPPLGTNPLVYQLGEVLLLVNGMDDDGDGWIDEGFDGIDNDGDGLIDPGYNGLPESTGNLPRADPPGDFVLNAGGEYEPERLPTQLSEYQSYTAPRTPLRYVIHRRPVVAERAQEVVLPADVVIDMTSWNAGSATDGDGVPYSSERSKLPVDPYTGAVDILISPTGGLMPATAGQSAASADPYSQLPFLHFWLTEREDVVPWNAAGVGGANLLLPVPAGTPGYAAGAPSLRRERRLVTLFARTGQVISNSIEDFQANASSGATAAQNQAINAARPYLQAQSGIRENP